MKMIILAAGMGTRLRPHTEHAPKCMVEIHGRPLIDWLIDVAHGAGITDLTLVGGYMHDMLERYPARLIVNEQYETTNMVYSLSRALDAMSGDVIVSYSDILYEPRVLEAVIQSPHGIAVATDRRWLELWRRRFDDPLSDAESLILTPDGSIADIGAKTSDFNAIQGQFTGLMKFSGAGLAALTDALHAGEAAAAMRGRGFAKMYMTDLLQRFIDTGVPVHPAWIDGGWFEVDSLHDLEIAKALMVPGRDPAAPGFVIGS